MRKDLGVKHFKIQLEQELKRNDLPQRKIFGEWSRGKFLYREIAFSNEAHFWLNGYVNKENCRFWSEGQPEALQKVPMYHNNEKQVICPSKSYGPWSFYKKFIERKNRTNIFFLHILVLMFALTSAKACPYI